MKFIKDARIRCIIQYTRGYVQALGKNSVKMCDMRNKQF